MKTTTDKWMRRAFAALLGGMLVACSGEETTEPEQPTQTETTGEVSFSIGNGTTGAPNVVSGAGTTDMTISQRSTYHDPDGTTFTCEPMASIKVSAAQDTLCAKDLKALLTMAQRADAPAKTTTGSVTTTKSVQTFDVGGQEITFDLAYETYTHVNSQDKTIEMPYVKVNAAQYGAADTEEQTRSSGPAAVTAIRLTPIGDQTRGTLTDSTAYRVSVSFTVGLESVHAKSAQAETLSVEVEYIGIVETTTEYPDPTVDLSYTLSVLGGTASQASPFEVRRGETLALQWDESSRYTYFSIEELSQQTVLYEPKVWVELSAAADTVFVDDKDDLEKATVGEPNAGPSADNQNTVTNQAAITIGPQTLTLDWSYDTVEDITVDGNSVAMPYLVLSEPEVVSVSISEPQDAKIDGTDAKVYEVTAKIRQKLTGVNTKATISEDVEYVVKYIGVQKIKLVKVVYRKDFEWVEPHDNLPLAYYPVVYRDRIYSNGETYTDTFRDYGHIGAYVSGLNPGEYIYGAVRDFNGESIIYHPWYREERVDGIYSGSWKIGVPDVALLSEPYINVGYAEERAHGNWDLYITSKTYEGLDAADSGVEFVGSSGVSDRPSGWYMFTPEYNIYADYLYGDEEYGIFLSERICRAAFCDQYLVIDGQMITFSEYLNDFKYTHSERNITMPNGAPAKEITLKSTTKYYERDFYCTAVDTVYQTR